VTDALFPPLIEEILTSGVTTDAAGVEHPMEDSSIPLEYARALHRVAYELNPSMALEVGCARGVSTMAILSGTTGNLISIDPAQSTSFSNLGVQHVERAGFSDRHALVEDVDYFALPQLLRNDFRCQLAYIDGWHTFDYALLDFFYIDKMLDYHGIVGFNDCSFPPIHRVLNFVTSHREYEEIDVGLGRTYYSPEAEAEGRSTEDRYFRKLALTEPPDAFYAPF
jgi:predicted O-methyltransferase YrrM